MRGWPFGRRDRDIDDELATHLAMATRDHLERGASPDEARLAAQRELGNVPRIKQSVRDVWSWTVLEQSVQDARFGVRILWQAPALSATAVLLLALVIGANTTIYAAVNGMLVSPARGVTAPRLVAIKHVEPGARLADPFISFPTFEDYARLSSTLSGLAGWSGERLTLGTTAGTYAVQGALVTATYFGTLGIAVADGRPLDPADDEAGGPLAVVISDGLRRDRFGPASDVVGRTVRINSVSATIVGVTAPGFRGVLLTPGEEVWLPIRAYYHAIGSAAVLADRARPLVAMVGQHTPAATPATVRAELTTIAAQIRAAFPGGFTTYSHRGIVAMKEPRVMVGPYAATALLPIADMAPAFLAFFGAVTLLTLAVVSANVANLMLGRAVARQRDAAVRQSLGASRLQIVRMLVTEVAALALVACAASVVLAEWTARLLLRLIEPSPGLTSAFAPDWTTAAYAMGLACVATLSCALAPAARAWTLPVLPLLKSGEAAVAPGRSRLSNALVVLQLALSVVLLTSGGLAYRSLAMLDAGDLGFDAEGLLLATVRVGRQDAFATAPPDEAARRANLVTLERMRARLAAEPGVAAASYIARVPGPTLTTPGTVALPDGLAAPAFVRPIGPDYLRALGLAPRAGRDLTPRDDASSARVAVINEQLAQTLFPDRPAVGERLLIGDRRTPAEIVGVAPDALYEGPVYDPRPRYVFVPESQQAGGPLIDRTFVLRHGVALEALTPRVGRALAEVDSTVPIVAMSTMGTRLAQVTELQGQITMLVAVFAVTSLLISAFGQYAVAMFDTRRRTRELGVRMALGASAARIQHAVIRNACALAIPGLLIGFGLAVAIGTVFRNALFGVTPLDPITYIAVLALIAATSIVASYLPAWRAGRVNVVEALRHE